MGLHQPICKASTWCRPHGHHRTSPGGSSPTQSVQARGCDADLIHPLGWLSSVERVECVLATIEVRALVCVALLVEWLALVVLRAFVLGFLILSSAKRGSRSVLRRSREWPATGCLQVAVAAAAVAGGFKTKTIEFEFEFELNGVAICLRCWRETWAPAEDDCASAEGADASQSGD
jgi:hypothetical protein